MTDIYAKGMAEWSQEDDEVLDQYRQWQIELVLPYLGTRVLEIGAGNGRFAEAIHKKRKFDNYVALEPSKHFFEGLRTLESFIPSLKIRNCLVADYKSEFNLSGEKKFDSIFSIHVLEHVEDDLQFLKDCYDLLEPGGNLITLVPALDFLYSPLDKKIGHFRRYNKAKMRNLSARLGTSMTLNRYDNFIGIAGWYWVCKIKKMDYHTGDNKMALKGYFEFFSRFVLPFISKIEKIIPPPIGLNLSTVLKK